jgi:hypothetical protein
MLDTNKLATATVIGTVLQVAMVVAGHFIAYIALHVFMFGGLGISLVAGFIYGRGAGGTAGAALGGVIAGGVCALIGIAVSVALRDTPAAILVVGTLGSVATGAIGGVIGRLVGSARASA